MNGMKDMHFLLFTGSHELSGISLIRITLCPPLKQQYGHEMDLFWYIALEARYANIIQISSI